MQTRVKQYCILTVFVLLNFGFLNTALPESTTVTSSGIKFPDGTTQITAASGGGGASLWSQSDGNIYYNFGNVGIGTASPDAKLDVDGAIKLPVSPEPGHAVLIFNDPFTGGTPDTDGFRLIHDNDFFGTDNDALVFEKTDNNHTIPDDGKSGFAFVNTGRDGNQATALVIKGDGSVGIGTTTPGQKLSVAGTVESTTGGFKFPDGTTQATAATGGGTSVWTESGADVYRSSGDVGIGTTSPGSRLHVQAPTFDPQIRMQDGNGSWELQAGTNFHILKGTDGKDTKLFVGSGGNVGIGTTSPDAKLDVDGAIKLPVSPEPGHAVLIFNDPFTGGTPDTDGFRLIHDNDFFGTDNDALVFEKTDDNHTIPDDGKSGFAFVNTGRDGNQATALVIKGDGSVGIGTKSPDYPLEMESGAHVTVAGVWTNASSRKYKENIRDLTYDEAKLALSVLSPSKFNYKVDKDDEYVGFIAEDVPDLVATKDRKGLSPMDIVAVLTKVVQRQQELVEQQLERIETLEAIINKRK